MKETGHSGSSAAGLFMRLVVCLIALVPCHSLLIASVSHAGIHDRVVAFVDNQAITLSELDERYRSTVNLSPGVTKAEVLNTMINRVLLLREAKQYRIEAATEDDVMREYIDLKMRAFIRVSEADLERFYEEHRSEFSGKDYEDVREEIEQFLAEKALNEKLKAIIQELRDRAYIKIFLPEKDGS